MVKIKFKYTRAQVNEAVLGVLEAGAKFYVVFVSVGGKVVGKVRAHRKKYNVGLNLTIGRLNYRERRFLKSHPQASVYCK